MLLNSRQLNFFQSYHNLFNFRSGDWPPLPSHELPLTRGCARIDLCTNMHTRVCILVYDVFRYPVCTQEGTEMTSRRGKSFPELSGFADLWISSGWWEFEGAAKKAPLSRPRRPKTPTRSKLKRLFSSRYKRYGISWLNIHHLSLK